MDQNSLPINGGQEPVVPNEPGLGAPDLNAETTVSSSIDIKNTVHQAVMSAGKPEEKDSPVAPVKNDQPESTPPAKTNNSHHSSDYSEVSAQMVQMLDNVPDNIGQFAESVRHYRVHLTKSLEVKEG